MLLLFTIAIAIAITVAIAIAIAITVAIAIAIAITVAIAIAIAITGDIAVAIAIISGKWLNTRKLHRNTTVLLKIFKSRIYRFSQNLGDKCLIYVAIKITLFSRIVWL